MYIYIYIHIHIHIHTSYTICYTYYILYSVICISYVYPPGFPTAGRIDVVNHHPAGSTF